MDMYADDLISREELNDKIGGMRKEIERLENELKMVSYHLTKGEQLESVLGQTFKEIEDITDVRQMTNAQLKRIIQKIEVDKDGNVDIYLRLLGDLGLDETVLIRNYETQGCSGTAAEHQPGAVCSGAGGAAAKQGPAAYPGRIGYQRKVCTGQTAVKKGRTCFAGPAFFEPVKRLLVRVVQPGKGSWDPLTNREFIPPRQGTSLPEYLQQRILLPRRC